MDDPAALPPGLGPDPRGARLHAGGLRRLALAALIEACERRGVWKLAGRVVPENAASRALCRSPGFREVGAYRRHGRLDGAWRDCVIVERLLGEAAEPEKVKVEVEEERR